MTKTTTIIPYKERILILQQTLPTESKGGIIMPSEISGKTTNEGVVIKKGFLVSEHINEGDYVVFGSYDGEPINKGGQSYHLITEEDIRAIIITDGN